MNGRGIGSEWKRDLHEDMPFRTEDVELFHVYSGVQLDRSHNAEVPRKRGTPASQTLNQSHISAFLNSVANKECADTYVCS